MNKAVVVHTFAGPGADLTQEMKALDAPDIDVRLCGPCETPREVLEAVRDADVAMCMHEPYTREVLANAPQLKMVMRYGVGVDTIDLEAATEYGIVVGYFPDFCIKEVANHALAHLLVCAKKMRHLDHLVRTQGWFEARAIRSPMGQIHGQILGLLAFGRIAQALASRAQALNMRVIVYDPYVSAEIFEAAGVKSADLYDLAEQADYVSCHLPLTPHTVGMIDAEFFGRMKPSA